MGKSESAYADKYEQFLRERIAQLRKMQGLNASELSYMVDQTKNFVSNIESQASMPSVHSMFCIFECLGVLPGEFFDEEGAAGDIDPQEVREVMADYKSLTAEDRQDMRKMMKRYKKSE